MKITKIQNIDEIAASWDRVEVFEGPAGRAIPSHTVLSIHPPIHPTIDSARAGWVGGRGGSL
jgi:hypothetical protein